MSSMITARVPEQIAKDITFFTKKEHTDKSSFVRALLVHALEEKKINFALKKYQEKEITLGRAAEMADIPLRKMMQIASEKGIDFQYGLTDLKKDFLSAK